MKTTFKVCTERLEVLSKDNIQIGYMIEEFMDLPEDIMAEIRANPYLHEDEEETV